MAPPNPWNASDHQEKEHKWRFRQVAYLSCTTPSLRASDVIGSIDHNESGKLFASGGIARKIRICSYAALVDATESYPFDELEDWDEETNNSNKRCKERHGVDINNEQPVLLDHDSNSLAIICTPAKLSSLKWKPGLTSTIGCGDCDGTVTEWDVDQRLPICERYGHDGHRVYSLDYSSSLPSLAASASGDGTVRLWSSNSDTCIGLIKSISGKSVCSAEFSKHHQNLIAIASADGKVCTYDLRSLNAPLLSLKDHSRAASYVRWMGTNKLVSASIDSSLKLWDITTCSQSRREPELSEATTGCYLHKALQQDIIPERTFNSHINVKNFVGLSVTEAQDLIACGSETDEVFIYQQSKCKPILQMKFPKSGRIIESKSAKPPFSSQSSFVSSVSWQDQGDHYSLVAANSDGVVQVVQAFPG
ncbi:hypothetical protein O6H91_07G118700 [Diphasiastrum complanatum]|uniref:Uncharacterized protein n=1 Tax=Diphasiastrum complanatum TaxID=34168 RepID=A0ACC2D950_DIPCM|nr:hypothetical protein O6H91_07G118700 [Diphasiastrum complanatum]